MSDADSPRALLDMTVLAYGTAAVSVGQSRVTWGLGVGIVDWMSGKSTGTILNVDGGVPSAGAR